MHFFVTMVFPRSNIGIQQVLGIQMVWVGTEGTKLTLICRKGGDLSFSLEDPWGREEQQLPSPSVEDLEVPGSTLGRCQEMRF